ncbi:MAG: biopolymer transporter ExbD [Pseudomonadales bacterium]|nr:biopolymer transporter ExbD [Pseudomonadales bacterium]
MKSMINQREDFVPPTLQITSMMDMFTIILFFLLFSFSDKPDEIQLEKSLSLPSSSAKIDYNNAIQLMLSTEKIILDGKIVATIRDNKIQGVDINAPEKSALYQTLVKEMERLKTLQKSKNIGIEADQNIKKDQPHILLFCDEELPYEVIQNTVEITAAAGFSNFQLMVMEQ